MIVDQTKHTRGNDDFASSPVVSRVEGEDGSNSLVSRSPRAELRLKVFVALELPVKPTRFATIERGFADAFAGDCGTEAATLLCGSKDFADMLRAGVAVGLQFVESPVAPTRGNLVTRVRSTSGRGAKHDI